MDQDCPPSFSSGITPRFKFLHEDPFFEEAGRRVPPNCKEGLPMNVQAHANHLHAGQAHQTSAVSTPSATTATKATGPSASANVADTVQLSSAAIQAHAANLDADHDGDHK